MSNKFKAARRASGLSSDDAAKAAHLGTSTYPLREKKPDDFRLKELKGLSKKMDDTSREILKTAVLEEIFLS